MSDRPARDALGEALRLRHGIMRPEPWVKWDKIAPTETEDYRVQADATLRHLRRLGFDIVVAETGKKPVEPPAKPTIWRFPLHQTEKQVAERAKQTMREVRKGEKAAWDVADDDKVKVSCTMRECAVLADRVLQNDPSVKSEAGVMTKLAVAFQVFFAEAQTMSPPK